MTRRTHHRGRRRSARAQAGFTMIEVMIAILLTAIATSGIIGLYVVETRASGFSRHTTAATVFAQDKMEQLRTTMGGTGADAVDMDGKVVAGGFYTRAYTINAGVAYDDMIVTVTWTEDGTRSVTLRSRRNK